MMRSRSPAREDCSALRLPPTQTPWPSMRKSALFWTVRYLRNSAPAHGCTWIFARDATLPRGWLALRRSSGAAETVRVPERSESVVNRGGEDRTLDTLLKRQVLFHRPRPP